MSEAAEQVTVIQYCDCKRIPVFHIPNGGSRNTREAAHLKRQGVRPGIPDLCIPVARGAYHSLYIEMKTLKGRATDNQRGWIAELRKQGHCAYVCKGADSAMRLIDEYMALEEGERIGSSDEQESDA